MSFKKISVVVAIASVFLFAFWLRMESFWLPHWSGGQNQWVVLAMKLDHGGLDQYNLRGARVGNFVLSESPRIEFAFCKPADSAEEKGDLLKLLEIVGQPYYQQALYHEPPFFAYILMASHKLLAKNQEIYGVVSSNLKKSVKTIKPAVMIKTQAWAALIPTAFNLGVLFLTFIFGWRFFGIRVGIMAVFFMASNVVSVVLSHQLYPEDVYTFLFISALFLYAHFLEKKKLLGILVAGLVAGLAILTNKTGFLLWFIAWFYTWLSRSNDKKKLVDIFPLEIAVFFLSSFLVALPWFSELYKHYASFIHPLIFDAVTMQYDKTGWLRELTRRPPPFIYFSLGVIFLSPIFIFIALPFKKFYRNFSGKEKISVEALLWIWVMSLFLYLIKPWQVLTLVLNQEHRNFYAAYPAIALLASIGFNEWIARWKIKAGKTNPTPEIVALIFIFLNACWGVSLAARVLYEGAPLL